MGPINPEPARLWVHGELPAGRQWVPPAPVAGPSPSKPYTALVLPLRLHDRTVKTVLRKSRLVDPWFVGKYSFSPYQACAHGCTYCDGRAERYWVDGEFDRDIVVRRNAADVLAREVPKLRERGIVFVGSGISDAYQPPEADERIMPACGRVLADHRLPVTILTKSSLIARDLDLWSEVNVAAGFVLMVSLVTLDDGLRAIVEPGASPVEARLETLRAFKARGCGVGAAAMPLLPFLTDSDAQLDALALALGQVGVDFVLVGGLTLRPGRQKTAFFDTLRRSFADLLPHYERLYGEDRPSGAPRRDTEKTCRGAQRRHSRERVSSPCSRTVSTRDGSPCTTRWTSCCSRCEGTSPATLTRCDGWRVRAGATASGCCHAKTRWRGGAACARPT